jgi:hypothetical protein
MAKLIVSGKDAIGKRIVSEYDKDHPLEIIDVVDDIKEGSLDMKTDGGSLYAV